MTGRCGSVYTFDGPDGNRFQNHVAASRRLWSILALCSISGCNISSEFAPFFSRTGLLSLTVKEPSYWVLLICI
jgi:hypothetical protein